MTRNLWIIKLLLNKNINVGKPELQRTRELQTEFSGKTSTT